MKKEDNEGINYICTLLLPGKESVVMAQGASQKRNELISALKLAERRALSK